MLEDYFLSNAVLMLIVVLLSFTILFAAVLCMAVVVALIRNGFEMMTDTPTSGSLFSATDSRLSHSIHVH